MKKLLSLIVLMNAATVFAHGGGDRVGNGGDVIVCPGERTELLDLFQGEEDWGFIQQINGLDRSEIIKNLLSEFQSVDPYIAKLLTSRALEINRELLLLETKPEYKSKLVKLTPNELVNITDEGVAELPEGCKIIQAATQIQKPFPKEVKFTFQKKIWESLEADVQASLILHEVIYEHMISVGEGSSRSTRYLNAALHAGAINTVKDYFEVSSLFEFRNIAIVQDGPVRFFGKNRNCSIERKWLDQGEAGNRGGTTIIVNRRNVVNQEPSFEQAIRTFWTKYVEICD